MIGRRKKTTMAAEIEAVLKKEQAFLKARTGPSRPAKRCCGNGSASTSVRTGLPTTSAAANIILKKNNIDSICPAGIDLKIVGSVINNNGGPDIGSKPNANTAGIITNEANNADIVSNIAVLIAALGISISFSI